MNCTYLSDEIHAGQDEDIEVYIKNNILEGPSFSTESSQILIRRVVRLPLSDEAVYPSIPPRLWRGSRTMPGSPRGETPIVDRLEGLQRHASSLSNFRERFDSWVHLSKLLRVGRSLCFLSLVRLEIFVVFRLSIFL
jgi:hypothetical protein